MALDTIKLNQVIKKVFSPKFQEQLKGEFILGSDEICNTEYEGEISELADKVQIVYPGKITVFDHDGKADLPDAEEPDAAATELEITECPAVNFILPMRAQVQVYGRPQLITQWTESAAQGVSEHVEGKLAGLYTEAGLMIAASTSGTTTLTVTKDNAYDYVADMAVVFDNAKVPQKGRFLAASPEFINLFAKDPRFITYKESGKDIMANGFVGMLAGFEVIKDIYLAKTDSGATHQLFFGTKKKSIARAMQKKFALEMYKPEKKAAGTIAYKGHALYGYKLLRPDMTGVMAVKFS